MVNILGKIKEIKARKFYEGIDKTPYEYSNKPLANCIKEKGSFDESVANNSEIIGRALLAEMNERGKPLDEGIYNSVRQKFMKLPTNNEKYIDVADTYMHGEDEAICKYLIATWKHGDELGRAIGLDEKGISAIKNTLKDRYMPQDQNTQNLSSSERKM